MGTCIVCVQVKCVLADKEVGFFEAVVKQNSQGIDQPCVFPQAKQEDFKKYQKVLYL